MFRFSPDSLVLLAADGVRPRSQKIRTDPSTHNAHNAASAYTHWDRVPGRVVFGEVSFSCLTLAAGGATPDDGWLRASRRRAEDRRAAGRLGQESAVSGDSGGPPDG